MCSAFRCRLTLRTDFYTNQTGFTPVKTLAFVPGVTQTYSPYKNRERCMEASKEKMNEEKATKRREEERRRKCNYG